MKPKLEMLEDRIQPSVSASMEFVASPPASASVATITSYVFSMLEQRSQLIAAIEQDLSNALNAFGQEIAQEASAVQQQVDHLLGINPAPSTPSLPTAVPQPSDSGSGRGNSSGSGSGKGTMITSQSSPNQALNNSTQQAGSGSGSGSNTTTVHENTTGHGAMKVHPMVRSGSGGGAVSPTGNGSGQALIYGHVWLDNNGDGSWNNKELGYYGATVDLDTENADGSYSPGESTITDANGYYQFAIPEDPIGHDYVIQVVFPNLFEATIPGGDSQIDEFGYSFVFHLAAGGMQQVQAGLRSMNVTTTADDASGPIRNQVTLRDAIQTGNNGPPDSAITFTDPNTGQDLSGTISLQKALDPIAKSYDIDGPVASMITVQGQGVANPFRIFAVNAGVTSTIRYLKIQNGFQNGDGGGISNNGNLTLYNDYLYNNQATLLGGGIVNVTGAQLSLQQVVLDGNQAAKGGGGVMNAGTVMIYDGVEIRLNKSANGGAGISNAGGTVSAYTSVQIYGNTNTGGGGSGVDNSNGKFQLFDGGYIYGNISAGDGGGVNNSGGTMTLQGVAVQGNGSAARGGGIFVQSGKLTLTDVTINSQNKANSEGGGMFVRGGAVNMTGGGISSNTAKYTGRSGGGGLVSGGGGGLFVLGGSVTLSDMSINNNWANFDGGGVFNSTGTLTLNNNVSIGSNHANNQGGGMYLAAPFSTTNFNVVTVSGNAALGFANGGASGAGIYQQIGATVNPDPPGKPNLTDNDDLNGNPVKGP